MRKKVVTVQEVAEHAGVSTATVSRVARGIGQVSDTTKARVNAAIAELGFRPSHLGRALAARRHGALGVVFPGLSGPYHSEVIAGFEQEAIVSRLSVLILGTHLLHEARDLVLDMADRVDGIAVLGGSIPDDVVDDLLTRDCPVVQLAGRPRAGMATVRVEGTAPVRELTRHLIADHGYERLAFVGAHAGSPDASARWQGFRLAHQDAGLPVPDEAVAVAHDQPGGMIAAKTLFDGRTPPPRAVVCVNDETALGILVSALSRGMSVPRDVAITGFDDVPVAALTAPSLTTVRQPMRELGRRTVLALQGAIDNAPSLEDEVLPAQIVIRTSCGCPAPAAPYDSNVI